MTKHIFCFVFQTEDGKYKVTLKVKLLNNFFFSDFFSKLFLYVTNEANMTKGWIDPLEVDLGVIVLRAVQVGDQGEVHGCRSLTREVNLSFTDFEGKDLGDCWLNVPLLAHIKGTI